MPFITEEIWQIIPHEGRSIMVAPWPQVEAGTIDLAATEVMETLMEVIRAVRNIRSEMNIPNAKTIELLLRTTDEAQLPFLESGADYIRSLARVDHFEAGSDLAKPKASAAAVVRGMEIFVPLRGVIDPKEEQARLDGELRRLDRDLEKVSKKLANTDFLERAPEEIVRKEKALHQELTDSRAKLLHHLEMIRSL
jgi:valyl-tRNA synthetase